MKTKMMLLLLTLLGVIVIFSGSLQADAVVYEPFDYVAGALNGQNGGTGFDGAWTTITTGSNPHKVILPGSTFNDGANDLPVAGGATQRPGYSSTAIAYRSLSSLSTSALTADGSTMWFSATYNRTGRNCTFTLSLATSHSTSGSNATLASAGYGVAIRTTNSSGTGHVRAAVYNNGTGINQSNKSILELAKQTTYLLAAKVNFKPNGTPDEVYVFNITDMSTEPDETEAIASITVDIPLASQQLLSVVSLSDGQKAIVDEIRFAGTFAEAMGAAGSGPKLPVYTSPALEEVFDSKISDDVDLVWSNIEQEPDDPNDLYAEVLFGETEASMTPLTTLDPTSGLDVNSVTVPDLADGIYYWQVNTTIVNTTAGTDPCVIDGPVYWFEVKSDFPPDSVGLGADQITWLGKDVPLFADVLGDDGQSLLTYTWSVNTEDPNVTLTVDGDDNSKATLTVVNPNPTGQVQSVQVTVVVADENNPAAVSSTVTVDVYDTACLAARDGLGASVQTDLIVDCITDPEDLAELAKMWLTDNSLDAEIASAKTPVGYTETFDGIANGDANGLDGLGPWGCRADFIQTDGTILGGGSNGKWAGAALLRFDPVPGKVYEMSMDLYHTGNNLDQLKYIGIGFTSNGLEGNKADTGYRFPQNGGIAFMEYGQAGIIKMYEGPGAYTNGEKEVSIPHTGVYTGQTWVNLKIVLDTAGDGSSFTADFMIDDVSITGGPFQIDVPVENVNYAGIGSYGTRNGDSPVGSMIDNFILAEVVTDETLPTVDAGDNWIAWSGKTLQLDASVVNNAATDLTHIWTTDVEGVVFDPAVNPADPNSSVSLNPTVTITKAAIGDATDVVLKLSANNVDSGKPDVVDTVTVKLYDDACKAALGEGVATIDATDFDGDCITNLNDFAEMAAAWLDDYKLTGPADRIVE